MKATVTTCDRCGIRIAAKYVDDDGECIGCQQRDARLVTDGGRDVDDESTPTVTTHIEHIPESWTEEDVDRIRDRLESIADGIEDMLASGKSPEEIVGGWKAFREEREIDEVDMSYEGEFRIQYLGSEEDR